MVGTRRPAAGSAFIFVSNELTTAFNASPPRKQFVDPVALVVGEATKDICEPCLWLDAIEFGCFNQRVGKGGGFPSIVGAHEERDEMTVFRPTAMLRIARSAALLSMLKQPPSTRNPQRKQKICIRIIVEIVVSNQKFTFAGMH